STIGVNVDLLACVAIAAPCGRDLRHDVVIVHESIVFEADVVDVLPIANPGTTESEEGAGVRLNVGQSAPPRAYRRHRSAKRVACKPDRPSVGYESLLQSRP